jgi:hypothetical protein
MFINEWNPLLVSNDIAVLSSMPANTSPIIRYEITLAHLDIYWATQAHNIIAHIQAALNRVQYCCW